MGVTTDIRTNGRENVRVPGRKNDGAGDSKKEDKEYPEDKEKVRKEIVDVSKGKVKPEGDKLEPSRAAREGKEDQSSKLHRRRSQVQRKGDQRSHRRGSKDDKASREEAFERQESEEIGS